MRYSDAELGEFKDLILKKLETAKKELAYLQGLITRKDEGDMEDGRYMTMEDGSMSMEREQLSQMASRQMLMIIATRATQSMACADQPDHTTRDSAAAHPMLTSTMPQHFMPHRLRLKP